MNLSLTKFVLPLITFFLLLSFPFVVFAQSSSTNARIVILDKNQKINHDFFAAGSKVTVDGTVNGDAYLAGGHVEVNGVVNGDLLVAGGQVTVRGTVANNIRVVGGNILIEGNVGRNISVAGGNVLIEKSARIANNAVIAAGSSEVLTQVKDLTLAAGSARLENNVLGNVEAGVGNLEIASGTQINGNLDYWSSNKATVEPGGKIAGSTTFHQANFNRPTKKESQTFNIFFTLANFISSLVLGILLLWLMPNYFQKTSDIITNRFWTSMLVGFASLIIIPVIIGLLLITLIGIPLALFLGVIYIFLLYISKLFVSLAAGIYINKKAKRRLTPIWEFVIGLLLYYLVGFIPIIGGISKTLVVLLGLGAFMIQEKYYIQLLRDKKIL